MRTVDLGCLWRATRRRTAFVVSGLLTALLLQGPASAATKPVDDTLEFTVAGDMRNYSENTQADGRRFFDGACAAMQRIGPGAFLISPGDFDPPAANRAVIDRYLGKDFPWYIVVGNHEVENAAVMPWVRTWLASDIPHVVRRGVPGTTLAVYSWDAGAAHFVAIDSYPWARPGVPGKKAAQAEGEIAPPGDKGEIELTAAMLQWLEADLRATKQRMIFVVGHQPIESVPDMESGRRRHEKDSVSHDPEDTAEFLGLLKKYRVRAYICGHTHDTSVVKLPSGIWQCDSGHARGAGDPGSPSTFLKFRIEGARVWVDVYRADANGATYTVRKTVVLE